MASYGAIVPVEHIARSILVLRGTRVILDRDLAAIYGVTTGRLNEAVKRNGRRFPEDFMFRLTRGGGGTFKIANCDLEQRSWQEHQVLRVAPGSRMPIASGPGSRSVRRLGWLALFTLAMGSALAAQRPVVVELFTSLACSDCPPAGAGVEMATKCQGCWCAPLEAVPAISRQRVTFPHRRT